MDPIYHSNDGDPKPENGRKIIIHPLYTPKSSPWLDLRVFYIKISNFELKNSAANHLTLNLVPLNPDTVIEINGTRSSIHTDWVSSDLRKDRVDRNSEEATFVSTDSIKMTGTVHFQVFDKNDLLMTGDLQLISGNGEKKKWNLKCDSVSACNGFLKGKDLKGIVNPIVELYIAGSFLGTPIILSETIQFNNLLRKKNGMKLTLDSIPENEMVEEEGTKEVSLDDSIKVSEQEYKSDTDTDTEYTNHNSYYAGGEYLEGEDGELSWFNAGVRVGVGIGLGICVGVGLGVGLMVKTYQTTTRTFRRRLL
ncbi:hypothetical protein LUZ60_010385 [Juncus effusus]|nr:hypothetical protein LUZ60_010385 [Juncus effusus]